MGPPKRSNLHAEISQNFGSVYENRVSLPQRMINYHIPPQSDYGLVGSHDPRDIPYDFQPHVAENIGTTRSCFVCAKNRIRTQGGGHVYSRYKCQKCDIVLCRGIRNCFRQYHAELGISVD
jgi:hypothetical protein